MLVSKHSEPRRQGITNENKRNESKRTREWNSYDNSLEKNQPINAQKNHQQKRTSPCREMIVSNSYWLFIILTKSFFKQLDFISFQNSLQSTRSATTTTTTMSFSVSNNGTQWTLDFSPDSVTIIVKDMVQDLTISSLELPIAAFNTLINQRQQFLDNHLARVPITPKTARHVGDARRGPGQRW